MVIREILKENQPEVYKHLKDKYKLKEEVKNKNNEKLSEKDIKELMGSRRYKRIGGAIRQVQLWMNTVEPIRDYNLILDIADYLKEKNERDYVLFMTGIYLGRRISDMLSFKVRDVKNKNYIEIIEEKTNKKSKIIINDELKEIYKEYLKGKSAYEPLFKSREGKNQSICRQRAYQILKEAADFFEYKDSIGCHSLRKTFGYYF